MRPSRYLPVTGALAFLLWLRASSPCAAAAALTPDTRLVIGQGWAIVQETVPFKLVEGEQQIQLEDIPEAADLSSLVLRSGQVPVRLLQWRRRPLLPGIPSDRHGFVTSPDDQSVAWTPAGSGPSGGNGIPGGPVECLVYSPVSGTRKIEILYRVAGLDWNVQYQVAIRGELEEEAGIVSADLFGVVRIVNPLERSFSSARVKLLGYQGALHPAPAAPPGLLDVDDDLTQLQQIRSPSLDSRSPFAVEMPHPVSLAAAADTEIAIVQSQRTPADRLYVITSENYPLGSGPGQPLRKFIVFKNSPAHGLGVTLPPGPVQILLGGSHRRYLQDGELPLTPPDAEIRVDLGLAEDVVGFRRSRGRSEVVDGYYEEAIDVVIQNRRNTSILAEIDEKPPVQLKWDVIRANEKYEAVNHRLYFRPRLEALVEQVIYYRLRINQPSL